ncbi:hypothetical protein [Rhabdothermincola salaria]|uniref:hypothetical protein n=1 Tax=Rhabdothermincola salaria TaxID=2903142 RepID=UPI001E481F45|nr:hypothetical protein [Rhabdothermincola salaria]MCD9624265.1 hypothetical protein [Rhabdothermincola salaria]
MTANWGRSRALLAVELVGFIALTTIVVSALGALVIMSLTGSDDGADDEIELVAPDAQSYESATALVAALAESGHECADLEPTQYELPEDVEDTVVDAGTCGYGYLPLHVLVYDDAQARAAARLDGALRERLCGAVPEATSWSTVTGANWRVSTPVEGFDLTLLRDDFDSRAAVQTVTCGPADPSSGS